MEVWEAPAFLNNEDFKVWPSFRRPFLTIVWAAFAFLYSEINLTEIILWDFDTPLGQG